MSATYLDNIHIALVSLAAPLAAPLHIPRSGREFLQFTLALLDEGAVFQIANILKSNVECD